ncbi:putative bifunctional diguanylate cyclase/phosphodiesterase [Noviherbaspirillum aerium]|uniref:putative bifunctional diguanylate cyclase/phosphodiesterase n=1 Tax=Noviherbaspirillum aerium TaxID=2588497 RepID=UPI00124EE7B8|nr:EAL domain-containing protein [Noviherbaspirillum aerium]
MKRKQVASLDRANRMLTMLSRINRSIIRAESPDSIYRDACRIAVECGMFRFAWIGLVDTATDRLRLISAFGEQCGSDESLVVAGGFADTVRKSRRLCIYNDLMTLDERMGTTELVRRGFHAMAGLPLCEDGEAVGVFLLYTDQTECFDETVVDLMQEVADDIGFSPGHILNHQRRLAAESKLYYMAFYDAQTGMPNRSLLEERLPAMVRKHKALTLIDIRLLRLDRAAEAFGRHAVEQMLRTVAYRLDGSRGADGFLASIATDEFVLAIPGMADMNAFEAFAAELISKIEAPVPVGDSEVFLHASIGGVHFPSQESEPAQLLRRARAAADRKGMDSGFRLYGKALDEGAELRMRMEAELHRALERKEFLLYYQPQLSLLSGEVLGVEALLQWNHPERGMLSPGIFIPLLEECGLMPQVGAWVLDTACKQVLQWQEQGLPRLRMAVNVSALQFRMANLTVVVRQALAGAKLPAEWLELELTESLILENAEATIRAMHELKALGITLSLDDFGTGYSSLSYLRRYPLDRLKIDRSFINEMMNHSSSAALVRSILAMAKSLELITIAEGVETMPQMEYLRTLGCEEMQGYLFSKPVPPEEIIRLLRGGATLPLQGSRT